MGFNSRAPRGARRRTSAGNAGEMKFQFTCPSRSTTEGVRRAGACLEVSIHVPLAEHDTTTTPGRPMVPVSIHVPLAEHDLVKYTEDDRHIGFNSRAPRGARRSRMYHDSRHERFNSRAPRGARRHVAAKGARPRRFNSRAPRGARLQCTPSQTDVFFVMIRRPPRSTHRGTPRPYTTLFLSIHVPLAEHDH